MVRALLPGNAPFRAWSNFEFRDGHGKWHEVDLLVLGRRRLHLVELKYYSGTLRGDDLTWRRDGHRAEDSPLKLARRKAQRLASKLQDELIRWAQETGTRIPDARDVVPFVQESVFLHHPGLRCLLPPASRIDLFGLDGRENEHRPARDLGPAAGGRHAAAVGPASRDDIIAELMAADRDRPAPPAGGRVLDHRRGPARRGRRLAGLARVPPGGHHRPGPDPVPGHAAGRLGRPRGPGSARSPSTSTGSCRGWPTTGCCGPRDMVDSELGVGLVYPLDERFQRLDLWLADHAGSVPAEDQLALLRQVAEAVAYAHGNRVVHRGPDPARGLGPAAARRRAAGPGRGLAERRRGGRARR